MSSIIKKQYIASLILKERISELNESEKKELASWLEESPEHRELYTYLHSKDLSSDLAKYKTINPLEGLDRYRKRYVPKHQSIHSRWYWVAAAVILIISVSILHFYQEKEIPSKSDIITPGCSKAMLVLDNGNIIDLSKEKNKIIANQQLSIQTDGTQVSYSVTENVKEKSTNEYNELIIPTGGEFTLTLSDGTQIWLNSQSKIKYPVLFNDTTREVYLEGEAYFKVSKDTLHPFRVNTKNNVCIEVLGTSFNVRSYNDENSVETVLEEGVVKMSQGKDAAILAPGNKATCHPNEPIQMATVNTELYTAWRHGQDIFVDESVENIFIQLSRWYIIQVFFSNEAAKSVIFSGDITKYNDINTLLEAMEIAGGIHFKINGRTLIVSSDN